MSISTVYRVLGQFLCIKHKNSNHSIQTIFYLWKCCLSEFIHAVWKPRITRSRYLISHQWCYKETQRAPSSLPYWALMICSIAANIRSPVLTRMTRTGTSLNKRFFYPREHFQMAAQDRTGLSSWQAGPAHLLWHAHLLPHSSQRSCFTTASWQLCGLDQPHKGSDKHRQHRKLLP